MIVEKYVNLLILGNSIIVSKIKNHQILRARPNSYIKKTIHFSI